MRRRYINFRPICQAHRLPHRLVSSNWPAATPTGHFLSGPSSGPSARHVLVRPQQLQICVICETPTSEKLTNVSDVGLETLHTSCEICHRYNLLEFLSSEPAKVLVHGSCMKSFTLVS